MKEILRYPLVLLFALFILGCTAMDLTQTNREFSEMENRYLQQKPKFTVKTLLNTPTPRNMRSISTTNSSTGTAGSP